MWCAWRCSAGQPELVGLVQAAGAPAVGVAGHRRGLLQVRPAVGPAGEDLGLVGEVDRSTPAISTSCSTTASCRSWRPSVATPTGVERNVNADLAAGAIARRSGATKLVYLTDVPGPVPRLRRPGPSRR
jgi:acetylglutamate kinase